MAEGTLVAAADIARLAGVGRAAVSNWRRRHASFPQPVAGTPASPLFALAEVEAWLRGQGKLLEVPLAERAWQEIRARAGDGLRLAPALADAGERLASGRPAPPAVAELAAAAGPAHAFEVLLSRFQETSARGAAVPAAEVTGLMAALAEGAATVLDPACATGELLLAARDNGARLLLGQDASADLARLAGTRLRLSPGDGGGAHRAGEVIIRAQDALLRDGFPGVTADAVLCCPPALPRAGHHELDAADPRWVHGVPPRTEPELGWVQHAIAHLSPAGMAVVLMPQAAAARRPGRRIRAQLLRKGALRAVIALSAGNQASQLWLLRRPAGVAPATVLMMAAADPPAVLATWRRFAGDPGHDEPGVSRAVPVIDLLGDDVDLNPARYLSAPPAERAAEHFARTREGLAAVMGGLPRLMPDVRPAGRPRPVTFATVAELARTGYVELYQAPARPDPGDGPAALLTAEDVIEGRPPSGSGRPGERWVTLRAGDIAVASSAAGRLAARVVRAHGAILGPGLTLLRVDQERLDPYFVAGALRSSANGRAAARQTGSGGRADIARALVAQLPLPEQRRLGEAFRLAEELESAVRSAAAMSASLAQLLADGIAGGTLEPASGQPDSGQTR